MEMNASRSRRCRNRITIQRMHIFNARFTAEESERGNVIKNDLYTQVALMTTKFIVGEVDIEPAGKTTLLLSSRLACRTDRNQGSLARWNEAIQ